jgi:hypothetical protein
MTTFDPAHKHAKIVLSNGNLTVSAPTSNGDSSVNVRSTTGKTGLERGYVELRLDAITQLDDGGGGFIDGNVIVGVVNSTFVPGSANLNGSVNAISYENNGTISVGGVATTSGDTYSTNDVVYISFESSNNLVFGVIGKTSVPVDCSSLGSGLWYVAVQCIYQDDVWTGSFSDPFERVPAWDYPVRGRSTRYVLGMM